MHRLLDRIRMRLANVLFRGAHLLDPERPVTIVDGDGWLIQLDGISLARVKPGVALTDRRTVVGWRKP